MSNSESSSQHVSEAVFHVSKINYAYCQGYLLTNYYFHY